MESPDIPMTGIFYKLTVKVVPAEEGIALETFITDETGQVSEMVFTNTYTGKEDTPDKPDKKDDKPDQPDKKPSKKGGGGKKTGGRSGSKVKTGDDNNILLWVSVTAASLIVVLGLLILRKKNRNE